MTQSVVVQAPELSRRKIGEYVVTALVDGVVDTPFEMLAEIKPKEAEDMIAASGRPRSSAMTLSAYLIESSTRKILIDGGAGSINGWGGRLHAVLGAAGVNPKDIQHVLLTHAHPDHIGGLVSTPLGFASFPNADLILHEDEFRFWSDDGNLSRAPEPAQPFFHLARRVFAAYSNRMEAVTSGDVMSGISLVHLPGHTPGHSGYVISSGADSLLVWGDIVHYPNIQVERPEVTIAFDVDAAAAATTRRSVLAKVASDNRLIAGMHLNFPGFARVHASGETYKIVDEPWTPSLI